MATYSHDQYANCEFNIEQWTDDDFHVDTLIGCSMNALVALGGYREAVELRPERIIRVRHRARVIAEHIPDRLKPDNKKPA